VAELQKVKEATGYPERSVRRFRKNGHTRRDRWPRYFETATEIATEAIVVMGMELPASNEARWRAYVREGRRCRGCGARLTGKQRAWCSACKNGPHVAALDSVEVPSAKDRRSHRQKPAMPGIPPPNLQHHWFEQPLTLPPGSGTA
jgi:hypothetical protein